MNEKHPGPDRRARAGLIEAAGRVAQTFGFGRNLGQVYMHVYLSRQPQSLDDIAGALGISKGGTSMIVRQLESWTALRRVWRRGDRRDYYEASDQFGRMIRRAVVDLAGRTAEQVDHSLTEAGQALGAGNGRESADAAFLRERVGRLAQFRRRAQGLWESPVVRLLLR